MSIETMYLLPFIEVEKLVGAGPPIEVSAKFCENSLARNRYAIGFADSGRNEITRNIRQLGRNLWMPDEAFAIVQAELERFHRVSYLGVAEESGRLTYKIYLGFNELRDREIVSISIDWIPQHERFVVKEYQAIRPSGPNEARQMVRESLFPVGYDHERDIVRDRLFAESLALLGKTNYLTPLLRVTEMQSNRISIVFPLDLSDSITVDDIRPHSDAIADLFSVPKDEYFGWLRDVSTNPLDHFAIGSDGQGNAFITIYSQSSEPPFYVKSASVKTSLVPIAEDRAAIRPSERGGGRLSLVYALGAIGHDFGTEARRDAFVQALGGKNPDNPVNFLAHLQEHPYQAADAIWTLNRETTPIYAIRPAGAFSELTYERLREFLNGQLTEGVTHVSIPGMVAGKVRLLSGQEVPVIMPALRGMYSWSTEALVKAVLGTPPRAKAALARRGQERLGIQNFLERVYCELRNLGLSAQERATNFAATNALQVAQVFHRAMGEDMALDSIAAEPSSICRPGSECWDVALTFFDPEKRFERARKVYRFTVDVSDVVPVTVGKVRSWSVY